MITVAEVYIAGLTQANAAALIGRAHELGLPASVVRTVDGGFIVPAVVAEESSTTPPTPTRAKRTYTRKPKQSQSAETTTADAVATEE